MDSGDLQLAVDMGRQALLVAVKIALPLLGAGLVVGAVISIIQAATQVQEQTLSYVPKMFAVVAAAFLLLPWILTVIVEYTLGVVTGMGTWFR